MDQRPDQLASAGDETERLKSEIEDTRAEMGQTINEIQERLSPEHLMDQVKETVREATIGKVERVMDKVGESISNVTEPAMNAMGRAGETLKETGYSLTNTMRQNPIPCALVGLGLGWYFVNLYRNSDEGTTRRRSYQSDLETGTSRQLYAGMGRQYAASGEYAGASRQYGSSKRGMFGRVKNGAGSLAESAGNLASGAGEKVTELGHQATEGARWAGRSLQQLVQENPLAVGAVAVAVGVAVGLALPTTQMEHEYMGEASEKLMDKAQQAARDAMDKVKEVTQGEPQKGQPQPQPQRAPGGPAM